MTHHDEHAAFGADWWEEHYRGQQPGRGGPGEHLVAEVAGLSPGTALDAGCGTGAAAIWLAEQGWEVTAVDISETAVAEARRHAAERPETAGWITWAVADLMTWEATRRFDLVVSQYVHPGVAFPDFVARLAGAVGPGGTLLVAGHDHEDAHSSAHAPEPADIGPEAVVDALPETEWQVEVAERRTRQVRRGSAEETMHDVVVRARRVSAT